MPTINSNPGDNLIRVIENDLDSFVCYFCINARDDFYTGLKLYNDGNTLLFGSQKVNGRKVLDMGLLELEYYNLEKNEKLAKRARVLKKMG